MPRARFSQAQRLEGRYTFQRQDLEAAFHYAGTVGTFSNISILAAVPNFCLNCAENTGSNMLELFARQFAA
jgi:hypothetical protein